MKLATREEVDALLSRLSHDQKVLLAMEIAGSMGMELIDREFIKELRAAALEIKRIMHIPQDIYATDPPAVRTEEFRKMRYHLNEQ